MHAAEGREVTGDGLSSGLIIGNRTGTPCPPRKSILRLDGGDGQISTKSPVMDSVQVALSPPLSPFDASTGSDSKESGSQTTLNRRFSSPDLILLAPPSGWHSSRLRGSFNSNASSTSRDSHFHVSPSSSATPSPMPNGDVLPLPTSGYRRRRQGEGEKRDGEGSLRFCYSSMESLPVSSGLSPNFHEAATASTTPIQQLQSDGERRSSLLQKPQVRLNGSLLSIGNAQLVDSANKLMEQYSPSSPHHQNNKQPNLNGGVGAGRRPSLGSNHSECSQVSQSKRNLQLLQNVGRTIQRTHSHLKRTRFFHAFYLLALPVYTLLGALVFQALDGSHDDHLLELYEQRCQHERKERVTAIREQNCDNSTAAEECFQEMLKYLNEVELCYRRWHEINKTVTHPMSDFTNAVIYAFSVYTTIGYGTISASTTAARVATVIYGILGIPLFFAFIKEEGNQCRLSFIWLYKWLIEGSEVHRRRYSLKAMRRRSSTANTSRGDSLVETGNSSFPARKQGYVWTGRVQTKSVDKQQESSILIEKSVVTAPTVPTMQATIPISSRFSGPKSAIANDACIPVSKKPPSPTTATKQVVGHRQESQATRNLLSISGAMEQRRVFACGVVLFIVYLLSVSGLFAVMTGWDYFTAFYFLFNSVALIGFGDVFPSEARIILVNMFFIVMGVVLFSMCYFILQEEIRVKAFEASRKARMSISKYSLMLHTKNPWSRRNSPAFDMPRSPYSRESREGTTTPGTTFERLRKRRQSAPVITLQSESRKASRAEILFDGRESGAGEKGGVNT